MDKLKANNNYLLAFEGNPGSETYSLIPVARSANDQPWQHDGNKSVIGNLDLAGVTYQLGTAPVDFCIKCNLSAIDELFVTKTPPTKSE